MAVLKSTPPWLVKDGRVVDFGWFRTPFTNMNIADAKIYKRGAPNWFRQRRLKEWQHLAVVHREFALGFAVTNTHYMGASFCYFVNRETGEHFEHTRQGPAAMCQVARELWDSRTQVDAKDYRIQVYNKLEDGEHLVAIRVAGDGALPPIEASFTLHENLQEVQPLIVVLPIDGKNRPLHTHKAPCPVSGTMKLGDREVTLDPQHDFAMLDVQKTFYPYHTHWNWATCVGRDEQGQVIALNLVQNMIADDERYNENALWVDGALSAWGAARFEFDPQNLMKPWTVETTDGRCKLRFVPQGQRQERINRLVILSDFHQPFGLFSGEVVDDDGKRHTIRDFYGVCEHHVARF
jgi:Domain of unknown function (DUF2804), C-terminal/Domain of unknown function (DUF2804), N-terminal